MLVEVCGEVVQRQGSPMGPLGKEKSMSLVAFFVGYCSQIVMLIKMRFLFEVEEAASMQFKAAGRDYDFGLS